MSEQNYSAPLTHSEGVYHLLARRLRLSGSYTLETQTIDCTSSQSKYGFPQLNFGRHTYADTHS